jgi:Ser/Thr protein kinase RdoA (MazF antagonist)
MDKLIRDNFDQSLAQEILKQYEINDSSIRLIRCNNNFVFDIVNQNSSYILRITHEKQKSEELLMAENNWIDFLSQSGLLVSKPIESKKGNLIEPLLHNKQTYYCLLYKKALGESFKTNEISPELLSKWGRLLGDLHSKSKGYINGHKHRAEDWHYDFLNPERYLPSEKSYLIEKISSNRKRIAEITKSNNNYNIIHYDVNLSNFVESNGNLTLFDFDDCHMDFYFADIASSLFYLIDVPSLYYTRNYSISRVDLLGMISKYFIVSYKADNPVNNNNYYLLNLFLQRRAINIFVNFYRSHDIDKLRIAHPQVLDAFEDAIRNEIEYIPETILSEWN